MSKIINLKEVFIIIAYFIFMYLLYLKLGIIEINEAEKYILAGRAIIDGEIAGTLKHHFFYSSYILFLALIFQVGNIKTAVIAQLLLNILAAICLKKSTNLLLGNKLFGLLAQIVFLFCIPIQTWTLTLFSDSFFISCICILLYLTVKEEKSKMHFVLWLLAAILVSFARPPGVFFVLCFGAYLFSIHKILTPYLIITGFIISLIIVLLVLFNIEVETKGYIKPIVAGAIIVDRPDYDIPAFNKTEKSSLTEAYTYLLKKKGAGYVADLYVKKIISFFTLTRSYYSTFHNLAASLFYFIYLFALIGIYFLFHRKKTNLLLLLLLPVLLLANLTGLTYNEWHYRFTAPVLPLLLIIGIAALKECGLFKKNQL